MNHHRVLFSFALVSFGITVIAATLIYAATSGFTESVQLYRTTTYTVAFEQGLEVVAGPSTSTITTANLGTVSFFITDVIFVPAESSSLNLLYLVGILLFVLAAAVPFLEPLKGKEQNFCANCGAALMPDSKFCNKCGTGL